MLYYFYYTLILFIDLLNFLPIKTATIAFIKSPGIKGADPNKKAFFIPIEVTCPSQAEPKICTTIIPPIKQAIIILTKDLFLRTKRLIIITPIKYPIKYPPVFPKTTPIPAVPPEKTGIPITPLIKKLPY